jgi:ribosomal protein S18 acetylase RimI-like enzyme
MKNNSGKITIVEIMKNDAYLKEIRSKYTISEYYDIFIYPKKASWTIELTRRATEERIEKDYHGRLFEEQIKEPRAFAAKSDGIEIGWIELGYEKWNNRMRIWEFLIEEKYRRKGIGTLLMNKAVEIGKNKGARMLVVETQTNNLDAISFYLNFGFELIGFDIAAYSNQDIEKKEVRLELGLKL